MYLPCLCLCPNSNNSNGIFENNKIFKIIKEKRRKKCRYCGVEKHCQNSDMPFPIFTNMINMVSQNTARCLRKATLHVNFRVAYSSSHSNHFQNIVVVSIASTVVCQILHLWNNGYFWFRCLVLTEIYDPRSEL